MQTGLSEVDIANLLRGFHIPAQPQILADLTLAQAMPDCDLNIISKLISKDISITGNVLKVANSPFFSLSKPITTVESAILMIGLRGMMNIVAGITLREESLKHKNWSDDDLVFLNRFWDSSEDTAKVASYISHQLGIENPDEMYTIGLFHNAGIPILMLHYSNYRATLLASYSLDTSTMTDIEEQHFNTNHATLSYYLARSWKMPIPICDVLVEHHNLLNLFTTGSNKSSVLLNKLCLLKVAEHIAGLHRVLGNTEIDHEWIALEKFILVYLQLSPDDYQEISVNCQDFLPQL